MLRSDVAITDMIFICHQLASALFNPRYKFLYIFAYFASRLGLCSVSLSVPLYIDTSVDDLLVVVQVYKSYLVIVPEFDTQINLIVLDMIDFNVILGLDWLSPYHAVMDCFAKIVTLALSDVPPVMW